MIERPTRTQEKRHFEAESRKFADSAFPTHVEFQYRSDLNMKYFSDSKGLSKREYFAAAALTGLCVQAIPGPHNGVKEMVKECSYKAVMIADATIKELENNANLSPVVINENLAKYNYDLRCAIEQLLPHIHLTDESSNKSIAVRKIKELLSEDSKNTN